MFFSTYSSLVRFNLLISCSFQLTHHLLFFSTYSSLVIFTFRFCLIPLGEIFIFVDFIIHFFVIFVGFFGFLVILVDFMLHFMVELVYPLVVTLEGFLLVVQILVTLRFRGLYWAVVSPKGTFWSCVSDFELFPFNSGAWLVWLEAEITTSRQHESIITSTTNTHA